VLSILKRTGIALPVAFVLASVAGCGSGGDPTQFSLAINPTPALVMADYTTPAITAVVGPPTWLIPYAGDVAVVATPPPGFTCIPASCTVIATPTQHAPGTAVFRFDTDTTLAAGTYQIAFHASGGNHEHDAMGEVDVTAWNGLPPPPDFDFSVTPASEFFILATNSSRDASVSYLLTFYRYNHYTGPIDVSVALAPGFTCNVTCNIVDTADTAEFGVGLGNLPTFGTNVFTATVAPYVTRTEAVTVRVARAPPPPPGPPLPGGGGG
jgi:hypothetical protein